MKFLNIAHERYRRELEQHDVNRQCMEYNCKCGVVITRMATPEELELSRKRAKGYHRTYNTAKNI